MNEIYNQVREFIGIKGKPVLLSTKNAKIEKSNGRESGFATVVMHLAPFTSAGGPSVCPSASPGCMRACLWKTGNGNYNSVIESRKAKTRLYHADRDLFLAWLHLEIDRVKTWAACKGKRLAVRLNGTSDIAWEDLDVPQSHQDVLFYDYTKRIERFSKPLPKNYHLTLSATETTPASILREVLRSERASVAVVFAQGDYYEGMEYLGAPVIDGTTHDMRFLDPVGVVVGLGALGKARNDTTGFTHRLSVIQ